jgi:hypothetical protein
MVTKKDEKKKGRPFKGEAKLYLHFTVSQNLNDRLGEIAEIAECSKSHIVRQLLLHVTKDAEILNYLFHANFDEVVK